LLALDILSVSQFQFSLGILSTKPSSSVKAFSSAFAWSMLLIPTFPVNPGESVDKCIETNGLFTLGQSVGVSSTKMFLTSFLFFGLVVGGITAVFGIIMMLLALKKKSTVHLQQRYVGVVSRLLYFSVMLSPFVFYQILTGGTGAVLAFAWLVLITFLSVLVGGLYIVEHLHGSGILFEDHNVRMFGVFFSSFHIGARGFFLIIMLEQILQGVAIVTLCCSPVAQNAVVFFLNMIVVGLLLLNKPYADKYENNVRLLIFGVRCFQCLVSFIESLESEYTTGTNILSGISIVLSLGLIIFLSVLVMIKFVRLYKKSSGIGQSKLVVKLVPMPDQELMLKRDNRPDHNVANVTEEGERANLVVPERDQRQDLPNVDNAADDGNQ